MRKWLLRSTSVDKKNQTTTSLQSVFGQTYELAKARLEGKLGEGHCVELIKEET